MMLYLRLCAALLALGALTAAADEQPWTLEASNWEKGKDLLPEPVVKRLQKGEYWFKVVSADPGKFHHNYSQAFWDATEKNAGKYDLDEKTCGLKDKATDKIPDFVFGLPFPAIEKTDPKAGCKIAWNFTMAGAMGGGGGATFTLNGVDTGGQFRRIKAFIHTRGYQGRHFGPLKDNPEGLAGEGIGGALEPVDVEGVSTLTKRYWNWEGQDALWAYVPSTRRARRVNAATRSDPVAGLDIFADDLNCYAGKVEYYQWKLVGEQTILAPLLQPYPFPMKPVSPTRNLIDTPYMPAGYEVPNAKGAPWWIQQNLVFVPRPVWVVEGQSSDPYYNFGKVIMYFDKEMYRIYWKQVHNRAGEYFYTAMCGYHFVKNDETFSAVFPNLVVGVNDKTNRAALGGRFQSSFLEQSWDPSYFSLRTLTHMTD
ncbi:MAG TPA: DUF1329 domain-containing protein [Verrucomicrobiae bacterium]|nr:DUF1329 domain-containing protein [Verrucomicrobiae bacterium]